MKRHLCSQDIRRRELLQSLAVAGVATALPRRGIASDVAEPAPAPDLAELQRQINAVPAKLFGAYLRGETTDDAAVRDYPAIARLDATLDKVMKEARETVVADKPAVWFVYNMGIVVKTRQSLFTVDLCHAKAQDFAPEFDFSVITHNHTDHYTRKFHEEMDRRLHKTVITNFADNYGAAFHGGICGFARGEKTFTLKDVTVRTYQSDHNTILRGFTMPVEIDCGGYTIFHVGDTFNVTELHPTRSPDLWVHHCRCWGRETGPGAEHLRPKLTVVAHLHEMQHPFGKARWTFKDGERAKADSEKVGVPAVVPFWGDRIV